MNSEKPGNSLTIDFDDLTYDGTAGVLADAGWIGVGNQTSYQRREEGGAHDFGFRPGEPCRRHGRRTRRRDLVKRSVRLLRGQSGPVDPGRPVGGQRQGDACCRAAGFGHVPGLVPQRPQGELAASGWRFCRRADRWADSHRSLFRPRVRDHPSGPGRTPGRARDPRGSASKAAKGLCSFRGRYFSGSWLRP